MKYNMPFCTFLQPNIKRKIGISNLLLGVLLSTFLSEWGHLRVMLRPQLQGGKVHHMQRPVNWGFFPAITLPNEVALSQETVPKPSLIPVWHQLPRNPMY